MAAGIVKTFRILLVFTGQSGVRITREVTLRDTHAADAIFRAKRTALPPGATNVEAVVK